LTRKIQKLKQIQARNMIIAVDKTLSCSRLKELRMEVVFYEREVPVKPIIDYLNAMEEETIAKHGNRITGCKRLEHYYPKIQIAVCRIFNG